MALVNCPECGKQVSDQATNCPHCGYPLKRVEKEKPKKKVNPDLSKMEVIIERSSKSAFITAALLLVAVGAFVAFGIFFPKLFPNTGDVIWLVVLIFSYAFALFAFIILIIQFVKACNNTKIKTHCLYYDKEDGMFYLSTWQRTIVAVDAADDFRVGLNKRGFGEITAIHNGRRINLGFSTTNADIANGRVQEIRNSLRK